MPKRPIPQPSPETREYWEGAKRHELRLPRCRDCRDVFWYPRAYCPNCSSNDIEWMTASGRGTLHTYVIAHRPAYGFDDYAPYAIAIVKLDEGPHLMSNITGIEATPENLPVGLPLRVTWEELSDDITLPLFEPAEGA